MSIARHHAEWLSLLEVSGPFLSMPVLLRVFPQGLDAHDPDLSRRLRLAYEEWQASAGDPAIHTAWVRFVLETVLALSPACLVQGQDLPPGLQASFPDHGETLTPDQVVLDPETRTPRLLICQYPDGQDLDKPIAGKRWKAAPTTRMMELLRATAVELGLLTNGKRWTLVDAPRNETTGFASWYAYLWTEEPLTLRSFRSLLGMRRFFSVAEPETLEILYSESAANQQEVTDQLGAQVRRAVEVLVAAIDRLDKDRGRTLLTGLPETDLYEAALAVMMRLVFLLSAEERDLLLLGNPLYDQFYAVSTLQSTLREQADQQGEEVLERRRDAWSRLLALFRVVYAGISYPDMRLPAYGGSLFDPDRFPFLEGRRTGTTWTTTPAEPLLIDNRTVLHLLEALQLLQVKVPGGGPAEARRLSFRALDIEQIGHVYEGLLDHTAKRATEPVLGLLGAANETCEILLATLETQQARGEKALLEFLEEATGRSANALKKALTGTLLIEHQTLLAACDNNDALVARVLPFANLIRPDSFGSPVVVTPGSVYVTQGTDRRTSGTHYTPRSLTEPIVKHALDPLVYSGPAEGKPPEEWRLRPAAEILNLKVCDMAMGSGAFLVQVCRYLAEKLVEAWEDAGQHLRRLARAADAGDRPGRPISLVSFPLPQITPEGHASTGAPGETLIPTDITEQLALARRLVSERCLYGVDKNPMAVEMAKLSLWLITLDKGRPFTFLDHALKCGDSLLGVSNTQLKLWSLDVDLSATELHQRSWMGHQMEKALAIALQKRRQISTMKVLDAHDNEIKARLLAEAEEAMALLVLGGDLLIGTALATPKRREALQGTLHHEYMVLVSTYETARDERFTEAGKAGGRAAFKELRAKVDALLGKRTDPYPVLSPARRKVTQDGFVDEWQDSASQEALDSQPQQPQQLFEAHTDSVEASLPAPGTSEARQYRATQSFLGRERGPFHWPLEFPEVFADEDQQGFDALVGNPPFQGGQKITGALGTDYRDYLVEYLARGKRGSADLCAYFFLRAASLVRAGGQTALLATNTIAQGDTREVGLDQVTAAGWTIPRAVPSRKWPGTASLEVAHVWLRRGEWRGPYLLADKLVSDITPFLTVSGATLGNPYRLVENASKSFIGSYVLGMGFVLEPDEAKALISKDPRNRDVLFPYLNGEDLNSRPDQSPSRWVINFHDWSLERAEEYPDCLNIVREKVKPERQRKNEKGEYALRRPLPEKWWIYGEKRPALYSTIAGMKRVLVRGEVSSHFTFGWRPTTEVFSHMLIVWTTEEDHFLTLLQSTIHGIWTLEYASTLGKGIRYTPSDCFETFPFPRILTDLDAIGEQYYQLRQAIMPERQEGLTQTYNRFHNPKETAVDIQQLRTLHREMDQQVALAYGWKDLDLGHGFHETKMGLRYTISEAARREVLERLLKLNHERYEEEVKAGLHEKGTKKKGEVGKGKVVKAGVGQQMLF